MLWFSTPSELLLHFGDQVRLATVISWFQLQFDINKVFKTLLDWANDSSLSFHHCVVVFFFAGSIWLLRHQDTGFNTDEIRSDQSTQKTVFPRNSDCFSLLKKNLEIKLEEKLTNPRVSKQWRLVRDRGMCQSQHTMK